MVDIRYYKDLHIGGHCIVIGNGPSLADVPNSFLASLPSFGANRVWRKFRPTYYVCTDPLDCKKNMRFIETRTGPKFINIRYAEQLGAYPIDVIYESDKPGWNSFTPDPTGPMYDGCTVTYVSLELAYWMGFTTVYLVGIDHRYEWDGPRIQTITADGSSDPNHFVPNYHLPGEKWQPPNLKRMTRAYQYARDAYKKDGRRIINLTPETALDVFRKDDFGKYYEAFCRSHDGPLWNANNNQFA